VKALLALVLLMTALWLVLQLSETYKKHEKGSVTQKDDPAGGVLPGLPPALEPTLEAARKQGAAGLGRWLAHHRINVRDPRLAEIELDYAVLVSQKDPAEARRVFFAVKQRIQPTSPVYQRVQRLEKAFQ
jgi:hypothetical protein